MTVDLAEAIRANLLSAARRPGVNRVVGDDDNARKAVDAYERVYRLQTRVPLAAVWGPPGTGKTTTYIAFFEDAYLRGLLAGDDLIHYVAPSNELVMDTAARLAASILAAAGGGASRVPLRVFEEVVGSMRLYGSKIYMGSRRSIKRLVSDAVDCGGLDEAACAERAARALREATASYPDEDTRFLLTTEFQDVVRRLRSYMEIFTGSPRKTLHVYADEASKSPYYSPFRTVESLIEQVLRGSGEAGVDVASLAVIGDHMQAIATDPLYHARKDLLLLLAVEKALEREGLCRDEWSGDQCAMLTMTKRLPLPSHTPISRAFYGGRLESLKDPKSALKAIEPIAAELRREARRLGETSPRRAEIVEAIAEAIDSGTPVVIVELDSRFNPGTTFEPARVAAALTAATAIAEAARRARVTWLDVTASSIYSEMLEPFYTLRGVRATTVQGLLGGESDVHITILGKEWYGSQPCISPYQAQRDESENMVTLYYREPELLNVQLSRHSRLLVLVGNLAEFKSRARTAVARAREIRGKSRCSKYQLEMLKALRDTVEILDEMARKGEFIRVRVATQG